MEFNDTKDDHKAIDIEIPTLIDGQSEFGSELKEEEEPVNVIPSGNSGFFMIDEEQTSQISKHKMEQAFVGSFQASALCVAVEHFH